MKPQESTMPHGLDQLQSVSLQETEKVAMLRRVDTKFVAELSHLPELMDAWKLHYDVLEIDGNRVLDYRTVYLDTPDFRCYKDHHNGKANRYKIRFRDYLNSSLTFFEIKRKVNGKETIKTRRKVEFESRLLDDRLKEVLQRENIHHEVLEEKIFNTFRRITLVSKDRKERITIDTDIEFTRADASISLPEVAVIELKQEKADINSIAFGTLKSRGIRPGNFSKYVTAVSLLERKVKHNNLKPLHLKLQQLLGVYADPD